MHFKEAEDKTSAVSFKIGSRFEIFTFLSICAILALFSAEAVARWWWGGRKLETSGAGNTLEKSLEIPARENGLGIKLEPPDGFFRCRDEDSGWRGFE